MLRPKDGRTPNCMLLCQEREIDPQTDGTSGTRQGQGREINFARDLIPVGIRILVMRRELDNFGILQPREPMFGVGFDEKGIAGMHDHGPTATFEEDAAFVDVKRLIFDFVMVQAAAKCLPQDEQLPAIIAVNDPALLAPFLGNDFEFLHINNV